MEDIFKTNPKRVFFILSQPLKVRYRADAAQHEIAQKCFDMSRIRTHALLSVRRALYQLRYESTFDKISGEVVFSNQNSIYNPYFV